jgi:hypothetical protein
VPVTDDPWHDLIPRLGLQPFGGAAATALRRAVRLYLDTSVLVKLVVAEGDSALLSAYLRRFAEDTLFSTALARTELVRAVADGGQAAWTPSR